MLLLAQLPTTSMLALNTGKSVGVATRSQREPFRQLSLIAARLVLTMRLSTVEPARD